MNTASSDLYPLNFLFVSCDRDTYLLKSLGWSVFIGSPSIAKEVLYKSDVFYKPKFIDSYMSINFKRFLGFSQVVQNNGDEWKRHRKVINPIFNQTWSTELFGNFAQDLIDEWGKVEGKEVKVQDKVQRLTLDVFSKAIFDIDFKSIKNEDSKLFNLYHKVSKQIIDYPVYIIMPFLEYLPFTRRPELAKKLGEYHEFIEDMIENKKIDLKKGKLSKKGDLISAFIESNENSKDQKLTMEEIRDNLNIFIFAGHDTTSNTLTSTLYYLARYPEIQDKLRAQVLAAMGSPKQVTIPTVEQLKKIPLMDMVSKESMRMMTTVNTTERVSKSHHTFSNGLSVPKDTPIFVHMCGVHYNPSAFSNPFEFNPERFSDISSEESKNWLAFGLGNRTCLGFTFSLMEQRVTLAMLLQKFEFSINKENPDYKQLRVTSSFISRPQDLAITIKARV
ncbi:cytochrome P450 [Conidiobolus coronatus NRRL 28638]|uniref:Cytochrome P450 n=1 Tax=Conidiobolus coronatus (strain ATCC 28846 / CBS 209.66 / NRRL 28638) TaxID=796925 RepID=A0A137NUN9_CONC2|nr:cytochrome P450 [Conidiobolus coronatus NRRL 28638]|eukprot:KXN66523.1 cytochrome P450 [Conidiobolus coronatus NRRL 28638]